MAAVAHQPAQQPVAPEPSAPAPVAALPAPKVVGSPFVAQMLEQLDAEIERLQTVRQAIVEKAAA